MTRIPVPSVEQATSESQAILAGVGSTLGFVPNVTRLLSLSPIALEAFVGLQKTLSKALDARTRNGLALAVSNANGCNY
jgi:alkylhydroperoxidase family enzyme